MPWNYYKNKFKLQSILYSVSAALVPKYDDTTGFLKYRETIPKQGLLASWIVQLYSTLHAHALFISGAGLCVHQHGFERWFFSHVLVLSAPCMYCSDLKITPQRIKIIKMNLPLGLVGFFLIFGLNFKGNSSLTAPSPPGIAKTLQLEFVIRRLLPWALHGRLPCLLPRLQKGVHDIQVVSRLDFSFWRLSKPFSEAEYHDTINFEPQVKYLATM